MMLVSSGKSKLGSKNRFCPPAMLFGHRFEMGCSVAVKDMDGCGFGGKGGLQKRAVSFLTLNAPWRVHNDDINALQRYFVQSNGGGENPGPCSQLVIKRVNVGLEGLESGGVGFNEDHLARTQQQSPNSQDPIPRTHVNHSASFKSIELIHGQHPVGGQVSFGGVLFQGDVFTRMGCKF
jgi:hypothetical protein